MGRGTENGQKIRQLIFLVILAFWSSDFVSLIYFIKGRSCAKIKFLTLFILLFLTNPYFREFRTKKKREIEKISKKNIPITKILAQDLCFL